MKEEKPTVSVTTIATYNSHLELLGAAEQFFESAKLDAVGKYHSLLTAILFSAFSIEALGNAYGENLVADWQDFRRLTSEAKLRLVSKTCGIKPDFGKPPWQIVRSLIRFRNKTVYAEFKRFEKEAECPLSDFKPGIDTADESAQIQRLRWRF